MMRFWGESNLRVQEYGQSQLKENYLQARFEDLCANPEPETARLLRWAGRSDQNLETLASLVATPKSIGRWKTYPEADVRAVINLGTVTVEEGIDDRWFAQCFGIDELGAWLGDPF